MMQSSFRKVFSLLMAFVVLFSTMSFTVNMHYCGDTLVETAILKEAEGCGMKAQNPSTESCAFTKKSCCSDKQLIVNGLDELQISFDKSSLEKQPLVAIHTFTFIDLNKEFKETQPVRPYVPPLVVRQLFKLHSTYLI